MIRHGRLSKLPMRQITVSSRNFIRMTSCFIAIIPILPKIFKPGLKAAYFLVFWRTPKIWVKIQVLWNLCLIHRQKSFGYVFRQLLFFE